MAYPIQPGWQQSAPPPLPASATTNTMAIVALVLAILFPPLGIILGHIARGQIKRTGAGGKVLANLALILGYIWLITIIAIVVVSVVLVAKDTPDIESLAAHLIAI